MSNMVVVKIMGGLASQIEKYIFAYQIAQEMNQELVLDLSDYFAGYFRPFVLHYLSLPDCKILNGIERIHKIKSIENGDELIRAYETHESHIYLCREGQEYISFVRKYPQFKIDYEWPIFDFVKLKNESIRIEAFREKIQREYSVAVHIRRGDFVTVGWDNDIKDYKSIIGNVLMEHPDACFYFFSNDTEWVRNQFGDDSRFKYVYGDDSTIRDIEDFFCISLCNQRILSSVSSYGKYANILNWHNGGKEIAIVTTLGKRIKGINDPMGFFDSKYVRRLRAEERQQGISYYTDTISDDSMKENTRKEKVSSADKKCENRQKKQIIIFDGEFYNPWFINDYQHMAEYFYHKGYRVLYVRNNSMENKICSVQNANNMDGKDLGYNILFVNEKYPVIEKVLSCIGENISIKGIRETIIVSNIRLVSEAKYIYIKKKGIRPLMRDIKYLLVTRKYDKNAIVIMDGLDDIDRTKGIRYLGDINEDEGLLHAGQVAREKFADMLLYAATQTS